MTIGGPGDGAYPDWLAHRAASTPSRLALAADGRRWSFAELDADVTRLGARLARAGIAAGDRVASLLPNGALASMLPHALPRLGATLVPLNTRLAPAELAWQVGDAAPAMVLVSDATSRLAGRAVDAGAAARVVAAADLPAVVPGGDSPFVPRLVHPAAHVLAIVYTSGTTGHPKGAMLTMANFWWSAIGSALNLGGRPDDRWLACLPLFHVGGLSILLRSVILGFAAQVHDAFDADEVNRAIDEDDVTIVSAVPVMLQRMLDARGSAPYPPSLRCVLVGGGPVPPPLLERAAAGGLPVVQTYGLTETTSQVATLSPSDARHRIGSAGRALYPNELLIEGAGPDGVGEILVRGPVVTAGYAARPEDTAHALRDGWLHTGDLGRLDAAGFLYVVDRRDDLIVSGGENVYPAEVEAALLAHPAVADAAVVGLPDAHWGRRVVAVVVPSAPHHIAELGEELRTHCRALLAGYKVPREVRVSTVPLPRTASGKLRRSTVRDSLA